MRFIKEIPNESIKTSLFAWNGKFIVKFEAGMFEQIYKFSELDYSEAEVCEWINPQLTEKIIARFYDMQNDLP